MPKIDYVQLLMDFVRAYGMNILSATIILVAGYLAGRWLGKVLDGTLQKRQLEPPVRLLLVRVARILVLALALLLAAQNLGFEIMPLIAGLGVVGVGIGLATQGVLSNAVAGLTIIFLKPYRVGEFIEVVGVYGEVTSIELFSTTLLHADFSRVIVPNRKIVGEILHNYGTTRQLDLTVGVAYATDLRRAIAIVQEVLQETPAVLKERTPLVGVATLGDSSINLAVKPWVSVRDYPTAPSEVYAAIVRRFRAEGIAIPFPQREVLLLPPAPPAA